MQLRRRKPELATASTYPSPLTAEDVAAGDPVIAAAFGLSPNASSSTVTREDAMTVPAVAAGRQVICITIGAQPLRCTRGPELVAVDRQLLEQPDPNTTRQHVLTWTVDDLLFYGLSWWRVTERGPDDYPTRARRLRPDQIRLDLSAGKVYVDNKHVEDRELIRFDGPHEGLLRFGGRALLTALLLEDAVRRNADGLPPMDLFTPKDGAGYLSKDQVQEFLDDWTEARRTRSTGYVGAALDHKGVGYDAAAASLGDARTYQALEVARLMNLRPRYVNATSGDSMVYSNIGAERLDLVDVCLAGYLEAIGQRLSMPDVTPRGQTVHVDMSRFLVGDESTAVTTAAAAVGARLLSEDEARQRLYRLPPLPESSKPAPQPPTGDTP